MNRECSTQLTITFSRTIILLTAWIVAHNPSPLFSSESLSLPSRFVVSCGEHDRTDTPISVSIPELEHRTDQVRLIEIHGNKTTDVPVQIRGGDTMRMFWILRGTTPAKSRRTFELREGQPVRASKVETIATENYLEIKRDRASILRYNTSAVDTPKGVDPKYSRAAYIHPVWTPSGKIVTDHLNPASDHPHQIGIWSAYTKTKFQGRKPNFWSYFDGGAETRLVECTSKTSGPVFGGFRVRHEHVDRTGTRPVVALIEDWDVRVWNVGGAEARYWLCDVTSLTQCATDDAVTVAKDYYGGFAIRGAQDWVKGCEALTSEGKTRINGNHTRVRWCDVFGKVDDAIAGLSVMSHPQNFRFSEPVRIHPKLPYFCFTTAHLGQWSIDPGKPHRIHYRLVIHDGPPVAGEIQRIWRDFAEPPRVERLSDE